MGLRESFGLCAPRLVRSVFYHQWKDVMGLITILQVRKLRLWDIMRLSWGHILISTEPEGNPDFWHSALSTELIISLLSICGALIHFYHQWVMTQHHCSLSWSCNAKWAFSNSSEPNGWVETQMPARRGLWGAIPVPPSPSLQEIPALRAGQPQLLWKAGSAFLCPAAPTGARSCPARAWLKLMVHLVYIPSVGWPE